MGSYGCDHCIKCVFIMGHRKRLDCPRHRHRPGERYRVLTIVVIRRYFSAL